MKHPYRLACTVLLFIFCTFSAMSQVARPFSVLKQITQRGGLVYLSNAAIHCSADPPNSVGACQAAANEMPPGGSYENNSFVGQYVDIDNDPSTYMSSSDSLNLPACSEISWAGLFWGAARSSTLTIDSGKTILIKANNGSYANITATIAYTNTVSYNSYHCFADITTFMQNAGNYSRLTVANIYSDRVGVGNNFGSWILVVMYRNVNSSLRQLTCFEGLTGVANSTSPVDFPITGFLTPATGPVSFEVGCYVHDGDRGTSSDELKFDGGNGFVNISDALNPQNNVMNSTISNNGVLTPYRIPSLKNTLGLDADIFVPDNTLKNYIGNAVSSATVEITKYSGNYLIQLMTTVIDAYEPNLQSFLKVKDVNGGTVNPGDILEYTVKGINIGLDTSLSTFFLIPSIII